MSFAYFPNIFFWLTFAQQRLLQILSCIGTSIHVCDCVYSHVCECSCSHFWVNADWGSHSFYLSQEQKNRKLTFDKMALFSHYLHCHKEISQVTFSWLAASLSSVGKKKQWKSVLYLPSISSHLQRDWALLLVYLESGPAMPLRQTNESREESFMITSKQGNNHLQTQEQTGVSPLLLLICYFPVEMWLSLRGHRGELGTNSGNRRLKIIEEILCFRSFTTCWKVSCIMNNIVSVNFHITKRLNHTDWWSVGFSCCS